MAGHNDGGPSGETGPSSIAITLAHGDVLPCGIVDAPAGGLPFGHRRPAPACTTEGS